MRRVQNWLLLIVAGGVGVMIADSPTSISENVCAWLNGANLSCPKWLAESLDTWLAYALIYGAIGGVLLYLLISLFAASVQRRQLSKHPTVQPNAIVLNLARTWAEHGTWTPTFLFQNKGDLEIEIVNSYGRYWYYGAYVEIDAALTFRLRYTTVSGTAQILGLPFVSNEDTSVLVECGGHDLTGVIKCLQASLQLSATSSDFAPGVHALRLTAFYKTA